ncbi:hypothetical protein ASE67_16215 [Sphingomonas sp. Leaf23]|nr:hypothetical protein ASE67_16215 [Sphingomonas sp. Leaf23]
MALTALAWIAAATLHEGAGHGLACKAVGGEPLAWSTFHFECGRQAVSAWGGRIVAGAGTAVNLTLMALGWLWWRNSATARGWFAGWVVFALNGLTSFGYLVFSAAFDIGDWNRAGVMAGSPDSILTRGALAAVGVAGYFAIVRMAAAMLCQKADGAANVADVRRMAIVVWVTTGAISLMAAVAAGSDWRATIGASIGVALGGNAGLLSVARFVKPATSTAQPPASPSWPLCAAAGVAVVAFVAVLGPGVKL